AAGGGPGPPAAVATTPAAASTDHRWARVFPPVECSLPRRAGVAPHSSEILAHWRRRGERGQSRRRRWRDRRSTLSAVTEAGTMALAIRSKNVIERTPPVTVRGRAWSWWHVAVFSMPRSARGLRWWRRRRHRRRRRRRRKRSAGG